MSALPQANQRTLDTPFGQAVGASYRWEGGQYCAIHTARGVVACGHRKRNAATAAPRAGRPVPGENRRRKRRGGPFRRHPGHDRHAGPGKNARRRSGLNVPAAYRAGVWSSFRRENVAPSRIVGRKLGPDRRFHPPTWLAAAGRYNQGQFVLVFPPKAAPA